MKIAVIVTTYNRPDALEAVLKGFDAQSDRGFELLVADDGSTTDTSDLIRLHAKTACYPLRQVWQEDNGFRPGAVRNLALARTTADYVIFTDGDCIPATDFVYRHRRLAQPGFFLGGNRILLSENFTARVLHENLPIHNWGFGLWLRAWLRRDINRLLPLLRLPDCDFRQRYPGQWEGIKTCNLSAWRKDLVYVNGFDETYSGWGLEDSDLVIRLINAGIRHKNARFATPLFHLWHRENDRSRLPDNQRRLSELLATPRIEAIQGLRQYG